MWLLEVFHFPPVLWALAIVSFILWILPIISRYRRIQKMLSVIPGPNIPGFRADLNLYLSQNLPASACIANAAMNVIPELYRAKSQIASAWLTGMYPGIVVFKAKALEDIFTNTVIINKIPEYSLFDKLFGNGLITSKDDVWRKHRKILTPAFHFRILDEFISIMNDHAKKLLRLFEDEREATWHDVSPLISDCALRVICETSMGVRIEDGASRINDYVSALTFLMEQTMKRIAKPWLRPKWIYYLTPDGWKHQRSVRTLRSFVSKVIKQRKEQLLKCSQNGYNKMISTRENDDSKSKIPLALLDLLLQYHMQDGEFTEDDILSHAISFTFAGYDTSTNGMIWCLYFLGLNPEAQRKVLEELDEVFGQDRDRDFKNEDLKKLKYLEWAIKEALRLRPPVPIIAREVTEDIKIDQYVVPGGCNCYVSIYGAHMDPEVFPEPHKFIPERFSPEQSRGRNPFAYVPFSAGQRNCIGQRFAMNEMKIVIGTILRKFQIVSLDPVENIRIDASIILKPVDPIRMKMIRR